MSNQDFSNPPDSDTFRLFIVTDTHLGYKETDNILGNDSFNSFEECLQLAVANNCEAILFGGDLFHENKPSKQTMVRCMNLIRQYCMGDNPVRFQIISDPSLHFGKNNVTNYEDINFNISLPIFAIHGNHDDPAGYGGYAALDVLHACRLINYFGKSKDINNLELYPILLKKGSTKLALYGLGNIRDERLYRSFQQKQVKWIRPKDNMDEWFNILMLHQNRVKHTAHYKDVIPEQVLPSFLDIVYWAHEHECSISLTKSLAGGFHITQPGSTVVTQLQFGETRKKHCGILEVRGGQCRLIPIQLKSVRPFYMEEVSLTNENMIGRSSDEIEEYLSNKIRNIIDNNNEDKHHKNSKSLPLIRLRVDSKGLPTINMQRFGQPFVGHVGNPEDLIIIYRQPLKRKQSAKEAENGMKDLEIQVNEGPKEITHLMKNFLPKLSILNCFEMEDALDQFVNKNELHALENFCSSSLDNIRKILFQKKYIDSEVKINNIIEEYMDEKGKLMINKPDMKNLEIKFNEEKSAQNPLINDKYDNKVISEDSESEEELIQVKNKKQNRKRKKLPLQIGSNNKREIGNRKKTK